jgi:hypothetical protein
MTIITAIEGYIYMDYGSVPMVVQSEKALLKQKASAESAP